MKSVRLARTRFVTSTLVLVDLIYARICYFIFLHDHAEPLFQFIYAIFRLSHLRVRFLPLQYLMRCYIPFFLFVFSIAICRTIAILYFKF